MRRTILQAKFAVRKARPGLGQGLFATAPLRRGDFILEYKGKKIPTVRADMLKSRYLFEVDRQWTINGRSRANIARYVNHSCEPNCEAELRDLPAQVGGHVLIYAARDIEKGEELAIDYGQEYFDEFIRPLGCKCEACTRPKVLPSRTQSFFARLRSVV